MPKNHLRPRILLHLKIDDRKMEDRRLRHILVTAEEHADSKGQVEQENASLTAAIKAIVKLRTSRITEKLKAL